MTRFARHSSLETRTARTRLRIRRTPYFAKIAKGLRLGYYRGAIAGSWTARHYRGGGVYATEAIGAADDTLEADGLSVLDYWQAQEHARRWADRQRQIAEGRLRDGPYPPTHQVVMPRHRVNVSLIQVGDRSAPWRSSQPPAGRHSAPDRLRCVPARAARAGPR
jgi:hypothetical protein